MRLLTFMVIALASACMVETARGPASYRAPAMGEPAVTCADEQPTGSAITRRICRTEPSPTEHMAASAWRSRYPRSPVREGSHSTTTPFLHVYQ
jgi:hypothetical protein